MKMIEMLYERHSFMKKDSMKQEQLIWVVIIVVGDINHWLTCLTNDSYRCSVGANMVFLAAPSGNKTCITCHDDNL
jgi:hypothetical protein